MVLKTDNHNWLKLEFVSYLMNTRRPYHESKIYIDRIILGACFTFTLLQVATGEAQQCDPNPACNPTSGTCCNQCDPNPACVMDDPNAIPCCGLDENDMSSGTPPQRGSAPPEHGEMSHDRVPQHKMGGKLREKLEECHNKLEMQSQPQPTLAQSNPAPNCTGPVQQATSANQALDEICGLIQETYDSYKASNPFALAQSHSYINFWRRLLLGVPEQQGVVDMCNERSGVAFRVCRQCGSQ